MAKSKTNVLSLWAPHDKPHDLRQYESIRQISKATQVAQPPPTTKPTDPQFDIMDFSAGFVAGCAGVIVGHPFDTIKVRQQTLGPSYSTMWKCVNNTITKEGCLGLYKGLLFPLATQGCINCLFFGVYERIKGDSSASYGRIALAGAVGGAVQSTLASPIELVKIKMQNQTANRGRHYKGPFHYLTIVVKTHGMSSLTRGMTSTTLRDSMGFCLYMTSFEYMCRRCCHPDGPDGCTVSQLMLTGGLAGALSWFVNFPIDTTKSRIQGDSLGQPKYNNFRQTFLLIVKQEGPRALFKGLPAVLLRSFALNAVTLTTYSSCRQYLTGSVKQLAYE